MEGKPQFAGPTPVCWLASGALAQSVWNHAFGFAPEHGVSDVDLVYFDAVGVWRQSGDREE